MKLMKTTLILIFALIVGLNAIAQVYDADLAKKLGADDNGMKKYVLVILKTGSYEPKTKSENDYKK